MENKKKTATISQLVKELEAYKKEVGDVKVYVVQATDAAVGENVHFSGLSQMVAALRIVQGDESGVLIFQSDEILKP